MTLDPNTLHPACPQCGSTHTTIHSKKRHQYRCEQGHSFTADNVTSVYKQGTHVVLDADVPRIMKDEELLDFIGLDRTYWKIDKAIYGKREASRKDRSVEWDVEDGVVLHGKVRDSGKMLIVKLFSVKVFVSKREEEIEVRDVFEGLIKDLKKFAPKYPKFSYVKRKGSGLVYELAIMDLHLGLLAWAEESGKNADVKLTVAMTRRVVTQLLSDVQHLPISRIVLPTGNDFFNVNDKTNTTAHGTPQSEDTRWQKTFRYGYNLMVEIIDQCQQIAPVDVIMVPGNHDEERSYYLGEVLRAHYHNCPAVTVDNGADPRKYYGFGKCLIGFAHGYDEKLGELAGLMALEAKPEMWAASRFREFHTGDKHHKKDMLTSTFTDEGGIGVVVRILRALSAPSAWAHRKGYVALRAAEGFLWDPNRGLIAQYTAAGD